MKNYLRNLIQDVDILGMCITAPQQIIKIEGNIAVVKDNKKIDISPLSDAKTGDWILTHAGLAIKKISTKEAETVNKILYGG